jgi:tetratricopeptide (TPR) repeat protein
MATLASAQNDFAEAVQNLESALQLARESGDRHDTALCMSDLAQAKQHRGELEEAWKLHVEARSIWNELGAANNADVVLMHLLIMKIQRQDLTDVQEQLERLLRRFRRNGAPIHVAAVLSSLGSLASEAGRHEQARDLLQEALDIFEPLGDADGIATAEHNLGTNCLKQEDLSGARCHLERALDLRISLGNYQGLESTYKTLAWVAYLQHDRARAGHLYAEFVAMSYRMGNEGLVREAMYKLGTLGVIAGNWKLGLQLLGASGLSRGGNRLNVAFDQPVFQVVFNAAQASVGSSVLDRAYTSGLNLSLEEAAGLVAQEYL